MFVVYQHRNKINGKVYIGITSRNPESRWGMGGEGYRTSPHFFAAIHKYGWDNFEHNVLFVDLTKEEACLKEQELIREFKSNDSRFGYNQTSGGDFFKMSSESKKKLSNSMKGNKNALGHPCSREKAEKISKAQKGRPLAKEHRQKLSEAAKKRHVPCSEEKRRTLSRNYPHKRKVYCVELDRVFESVQSCGRELHIDAAQVSHTCSGKIKSANGYHLKYFNDTVNAERLSTENVE